MVPGADSVRSAVRRVLDDASYRKSARELAAEIASMPDATHGVKLIECLVETGQPVLRESFSPGGLFR